MGGVVGQGTRIQNAVPMRRRASNPFRAHILMRGVVVATYVVDDPAHPQADVPNRIPTAVYCDVLTYGRGGPYLLQNALVSQDRASIQGGTLWRPRAATFDTTGAPFNPERGTDPANMDGDHVLVGFLDGLSNQPVILRSLPHPKGADAIKLWLVDGDPDLRTHHGVVSGVDDAGDWVVDTTRAWSGDQLQPDGSAPPPPEDGSAGNHVARLQRGAVFRVEIDGDTIEVAGAGGSTTMRVGDGAVAVAIAQALQTFWDTVVKPIFDTHVHTYIAPAIPGAPTPTLPPSGSTPPSQWPQYDPNITSTKVTIPNG